MDKTKLLYLVAGVAAAVGCGKAPAPPTVGSCRGGNRDAAHRACGPDHRAARPNGCVSHRGGAAAGQRPHPGAKVRRRFGGQGGCTPLPDRSGALPGRLRASQSSPGCCRSQLAPSPVARRTTQGTRRDPGRGAARLRRGDGGAASGGSERRLGPRGRGERTDQPRLHALEGSHLGTDGQVDRDGRRPRHRLPAHLPRHDPTARPHLRRRHPVERRPAPLATETWRVDISRRPGRWRAG